MLSWDPVMERNVKVWAGPFSTRVTKEVIGWKAGWCYMITPLSVRCSPQKQTSFVSPKEKQIDYILTKRRYLGHVKDAEANDVTHMGSDHRCVMAIFLITMLGKDIHTKNKEKKHDTIGYDEHSILNCPSLKKDTKKSLTQ